MWTLYVIGQPFKNSFHLQVGYTNGTANAFNVKLQMVNRTDCVGSTYYQGSANKR